MCSAHRNAAPESPRPSGGLDTPNLYHDGEADDRPSTPQEHGSPSFDYHEERRLHLKDEIYFSHRLPRLPPPAIGGTSGGLGTSYDGHAGGLETMAQSFHSQASHMSSASPSAFHPSAPHRPMRNLSLEDEPMDGNVPEPSAGTARPTAPGAMLDPSPYTGHDTRPGLLHRVERDSQERLDLQEERREKMLAEHPDRLNNGTTGIQQRAGGKQQEQPENGIGNALDSLYASFAKCLDLRDKYIALSNQRLGDNPRDHDGAFKGFYPRGMGDVMGVRPEADPSTCEVPPYPMHADSSSTASIAQPANMQAEDENGDIPAWKIYPPPPPPHWHWKQATEGQAPKLEHRDSDAPGPATGAAPSGERGVSTDDSTDTTGSGPANGPYKTAGKPDMYVFNKDECEIPGKDARWTFELDDEGVFQVYAAKAAPAAGDAAADGDKAGDAQGQGQAPGKGKREKLARIPDLREYFTDLDYLLGVCSDGPAKSFAFRRLKYLASKWSLYCLLNEYQELADMKAVPHRDFYNVRKVDTHIHHSASMNQKHLLRFIKAKLKKSPNEIVIHRDGKELTLAEVFESLNLTAYDLSIDTLDMHAHQEFHRFDRFNDRYNPTGSSRLREIFLKTDNLLKGKYLAELTQELITDLEQSKYQHCEWRLSIYGRNLQEWDKLAKWVVNNKLISHNVRWLIQVPRLYEVFKGGGLIKSFEDIVKNVFQPLFEVTADPSSHPELHIFLQRVVGFDSVDDESKPERRLYRKFPTARMWNTKQSPPYSYWIYYMYANMSSVNAWRRERGFNTFVLRPHCGEAGDPDHLSSAFLTSHSIAHGILLRKVPALQYLFYLKQIGLAMSPLSNNALFLTYERNPFKDFFRTGLNVSLSTDDPLQFHFTQSHLLEEYSCAAQIYKLTPADMCELARNSVLQSGWEMAVKKHWIGHQWYLPGAAGNDIHKTNVPTSRLVYRHQTLLEELTLIRHGTHSPAATPTHLQPVQGTAPNTGVPGLTANGSAITSSPVAAFSRPSFAPPPTAASGAGTSSNANAMYNENDIGAAAMAASGGSVNDQVAAAAGTHAHQADRDHHSRQGSLHKQPSMSLGMSTVAGLPSASGQGMVTAGVGALDEAMHRKRAMSMGKKE